MRYGNVVSWFVTTASDYWIQCDTYYWSLDDIILIWGRTLGRWLIILSEKDSYSYMYYTYTYTYQLSCLKPPDHCCIWCRRIDDSIIWPSVDERDMHAHNLIFATSRCKSYKVFSPFGYSACTVQHSSTPPSLIRWIESIRQKWQHQHDCVRDHGLVPPVTCILISVTSNYYAIICPWFIFKCDFDYLQILRRCIISV